ncbi:MAG TPA: hypothetical protein VLA12_19590, partial [Planctomycetaceae bacterium]|nr:hypothetical protein [Planctomycetaceae bacterium]
TGDTSGQNDNPSINDIIEMFNLTHNGEISRILDPGTYTVDEVVPEGWFTSINAILGNDPNSSVDLTNASQGIAVVTLASGETVVLEYTNTEGGTIVVAKEVLGDANQSFNFEINDGSGTVVSFDLKGGEMFTSNPLMPGEYTISELLNVMGIESAEWVTSITIGNGEPIDVTGDIRSTTVTLGAGETISVNYKNVQQGQINVTKSVVSNDANEGQTFKFELKDDQGNVISSNFLGDGDVLNSGYIPPGQYSVEELLVLSNLVNTVPEEWKVEVTVQGKNGPPATYTQGDLVELGAGETLDFQFTNTQLGKLVISKVTTIEGEPGQSATSFKFNVQEQTGPMGDRVMLNFELAGGETHTLYLEKGNYTISELLAMLPEGWTLQDLQIIGDFVPGQTDTESGFVTVNLGDGRQANTVELTFTNNFSENPPTPLSGPLFLRYDPIYPIGFGAGQARYAPGQRTESDELTGGSSFDLFGESDLVNAGNETP